MNNDELNKVIMNAEREYEMLKDKVHDQFETIKMLNQKISELYSKIDFQDKIINEQTLEIAKLKKGNNSKAKECLLFTLEKLNKEISDVVHMLGDE